MKDDLDRLLSAPATERVRKRRKRQTATSNARLAEIAAAAKRAQQWRLTAEPTETRICTQRTFCSGCQATHEAPMSAPMIAYRDRLGRTHCRPTHIVSRNLPVVISRIDMTVPACHECAAEQARATVPPSGQAEIFRGHEQEQTGPPTACKALVPVDMTPQAMAASIILQYAWDGLEPASGIQPPASGIH